MQLKSFEGKLGKFFEERRELAGLGIGSKGAHELDVHAKAGSDHEEAVLVAGLWFADVYGSGERAVQCR